MEIFDNVNQIVRDDLAVTIEKDSKLSIAAACFSIYAYQSLKKQLDNKEPVRFNTHRMFSSGGEPLKFLTFGTRQYDLMTNFPHNGHLQA